MGFLTVISPYWALLHPTKKPSPSPGFIINFADSLSWGTEHWGTEAWAVYPPTDLFPPGQVWGIFARHTCKQLALTLPALCLPDRRTEKSSGMLYNLALFMHVKLWSQAEDSGFPLSLNPQCATRNLECQFHTFVQRTLGLMVLMCILSFENCFSLLF